MENFDFGFTGMPRPSEEATLIIAKQQGFDPPIFPQIYRIDGKDVDNSGNELSSRAPFGQVTNCPVHCTIRLVPGVHSIEVNFNEGNMPVVGSEINL